MKLNHLQCKALLRKYQDNPDGSKSFLQFRRRVVPGFCGEAMIKWCGMWLGIETDGYTHS